MPNCPRCGTQNAEQETRCVVCGTALEPAPAPAGELPPAGKATVLGWPSPLGTNLEPAAPAATQAPKQEPPRGQKTMLGIAPTAPSPAPALGKTMLGIAPLSPAQPTAPNPGATFTTGPAPGKTMLGIAPLAPAGPDFRPNAAPGAAPLAEPPGPKTILGIARPGIAPLHPGIEKPLEAPAVVGDAPPAEFDGAAGIPMQRSGLGIVAIVAAGVALVSLGLLVFWILRPTRSLSAEVTLNDRGEERLRLACERCVDGTEVTSKAARATFSGGVAELALKEPLSVGQNELGVALKEPGQSEPESITLKVPVQYRVRGSLERLNENPPVLEVLIEAAFGTSAEVAGQPVKLDARGKGAHQVNVLSALTGARPGAARLEHEIPYRISPPDSPKAEGRVVLGIGIVPLVVEAPSDRIVIEGTTFRLSGRTSDEATVSVSGRTLNVDAQGRFTQLMNVSAVGETTVVVRASAKDRAPRLVPIEIKRVESLAEEARKVKAQAVTAYSAISEKPEEKRGWSVALSGKVLDARDDQHPSVVLLEVSKGCTGRCLVRVLYSGDAKLKKHQTLSVFGRVTGAVDGPRTGERIPEVAAHFVLSGDPR